MSKRRGFWMRMALALSVALLLGSACVPAAETPVGDTVQPGGRTDDVAPTDTPADQAGDGDPLAGSEWTLIGYGPEGALVEVPAGVQVTLRFEGSEIGGTAACNSYFGSYQVDGETLEVGPIGMTEMWCEGRMELEGTYLGMLGTAERFRLSADELVLETAEGLLLFGQPQEAAALPITGTVWVLDTIVSGGTAQSVLAGTRVTLELYDGKATGETGCNYYGADYTLEGSAFSVGPAAITLQDCGDEIMAQEALYMSMLAAAEGVRLEGGRLVIDTADGELVFNAGEDLALEGPVWVLEGIAREGVVVQTWVDAEITAEFIEGQVMGRAGCNNYFASYELEGTALTLGPVGSTMMMCDEEHMDREREFLAALAEVAGYTIALDELTLMDDSGKTLLIFKPSQDRALEGTPWALEAIAQGEAMVSTWVDAEITAQFAAGQVTGNAGCNHYFASYETDGNALNFGPIGRTEMACAEAERMEREDAFLAALEEVAGYQIKMDVLTLLDSEGNPLVVLRAAE